MKTIVHSSRARDKLLHIETEGAIVNIRVGLSNTHGQNVTNIEILPDIAASPIWTLPDFPKANGMHIHRLMVREGLPSGLKIRVVQSRT